ncbi:hypothetical protein HDU79_011609 [Rhizoclosmatium sp. JEL0117]|nr:hypothetical protein HDU79_011609 [Rhizoclosmatium sp. JEL0117]
MASRFSRKSTAPTEALTPPPTLKFVPSSNSESQYLQATIGRVLVAGITQVLASRCDDPVDALGRFLLKHDENKHVFDAEEKARLDAKAALNALPTQAQLDEMRQKFKQEAVTWSLDNTDTDKLFRPPTPKKKETPLPKPTEPPVQEQDEKVELNAVDQALVLPEEGETGISAIDNAIHGSQSLRPQLVSEGNSGSGVSAGDGGATIADLEQDAILPGAAHVGEGDLEVLDDGKVEGKVEDDEAEEADADDGDADDE